MNNLFIKILAFVLNLFKHGNLETIDSSYDLLTEKGEMSVALIPVNKSSEPDKAVNEPIQENTKEKQEATTLIPEIAHYQTEEPKIIDTKSNKQEDEDYAGMDDSLKKIYEVLNDIKQFEEKTKKLRNLKFAKREKTF